MKPTQQQIDTATYRKNVLQAMVLLSTIDLSAASKEHAQNVIRETVIKAGREMNAADWIIVLAINSVTKCLDWD